jgi:hypothetical protein
VAQQRERTPEEGEDGGCRRGRRGGFRCSLLLGRHHYSLKAQNYQRISLGLFDRRALLEVGLVGLQ